MRIMIGIPCYQNVSSETLEDYMRFAYYLGRRMPEHDFVLGIKSKTEQFRARNSIVEGALQIGCDYLLFLDDDHVIDWEGTQGPNSRYQFVKTFIEHFEKDEDLGIVGALYYHRGNQCRPVLMQEGKDGAYYWIRDDEIVNGFQEVGVQGGGCMMLRLKMFDKIKGPWFEPEFDLGTDIQICKKAKEAGYKVACDTSVKIGHVLSKREVITPNNRHRVAMESARSVAQGDTGMDESWMNNSALALYRMDAEEYLGVPFHSMGTIAVRYSMEDFDKYKDDPKEYYATRGKEQLARQVLFHHMQTQQHEMDLFHKMMDTRVPAYGAEFGCGSAPVSFELAMRGHKVDFIDVDGAGAYEFTKWRAKKRGIEDRCGWKLEGPYDYVFMLDSIEHLKDWKEILIDVISRLKERGALITNFFHNQDYTNPEHINMDKPAVMQFLTDNGVYPVNEYMWVKQKLQHTRQEKAA